MLAVVQFCSRPYSASGTTDGTSVAVKMRSQTSFFARQPPPAISRFFMYSGTLIYVKVYTQGKLAYIDILRGAAILLVLFVHTKHFFGPYEHTPSYTHYGMYGVQLFFIVSALSLSISLSKNSSVDWKKFMGRRIFRILPLYILGVIMYTLLYTHGRVFWLYPHELITPAPYSQTYL